jgi:hypothetical protein
VSGAQATYGSLSSVSRVVTDEVAMRTRVTAPVSFWPDADQIDRGQRFAAAFEALQCLDRIVRPFRFPVRR